MIKSIVYNTEGDSLFHLKWVISGFLFFEFGYFDVKKYLIELQGNYRSDSIFSIPRQYFRESFLSSIRVGKFFNFHSKTDTFSEVMQNTAIMKKIGLILDQDESFLTEFLLEKGYEAHNVIHKTLYSLPSVAGQLLGSSTKAGILLETNIYW